MKFKVFGILLMIITIVHASIPNDWYYGRRLNYTDATSVALGGVELFERNVYYNNPLVKGLGNPKLSISYNLGYLLERRTVQAYDQFDNTIGEVAISENLFNRGNLGNVIFLMPLQFMNVSASIRPQYSYNYYFYREYRDDFYTKIGETELKVTGQVYNASVMFGKEFQEKFGVGVGLNYYFGSRKYHYHDSILNGNHLTVDTTGSPNGIGFTAGFSVMPFDRLLINVAYQSQAKLKKFENEVTLKYPEIYKFNVSYLAAGEIPTKLGLSIQYSDWKSIDSTFHKTVDVGLGVEHTMFNSVALRYGFRFEPSFVPPTVHQASVSLGWGFTFGAVKIDVGGEISRRIIRAENLVISDDNTLKIYENTGEILIGAILPIDKLW